MSGKNGKEVGRISLRVLPNMDHFKRDVERGVRDNGPVDVPVEAQGVKDVKKQLKELSEFSYSPKLDKARMNLDFKRAIERAKAAHALELKATIEEKGLADVAKRIQAQTANQVVKLKFDFSKAEKSDFLKGQQSSSERVAKLYAQSLSTAIDEELDKDKLKFIDDGWFKDIVRQKMRLNAETKEFNERLAQSGKRLEKIRSTLKKVGDTAKEAFAGDRDKGLVPGNIAQQTQDLEKLLRAEVKKLRVDKEVRKLMRTKKGTSDTQNESHFGLLNAERQLKVASRLRKDTLMYAKAVDSAGKSVQRFRSKVGKGSGLLDTFVMESDFKTKTLDNYLKKLDRVARLKTKVAGPVVALAIHQKVLEQRSKRLLETVKTVNSRVAETEKLTRIKGAFKSFTRDLISAGDSTVKTKGRIGKALDGIQSKVGSFGKFMKKFKPTSGAGTRKIFGLSRVGWIIGAVAALAAPAIGLISGALTALPSLGLAAAAALGVTALGIEGIKKAASNASEGFNLLKDSVSSTFEQRLTSQFKDINGMLMAIEPNAVNVAHGLADFSRGMVNAVAKGKGLKSVQALMDNTAGLFSDLESFAGNFTSGLLTMGEAGSRTFPQLAKHLNNFGRNFNDYAEEIANNGVLERGIKSTYAMVGSFGNNIGKILASGLENLPVMEKGITDFFDGIGTGISKMIPAFSVFSGAVLSGLGTLAENIGKVFEDLGPRLTAIFDEIGPAFSRIVDGLGDFMGPVLGGISDFLAGLAPGAADILNSLGDALAKSGEALAAHPELAGNLRDLGSAIGELLSVGTGASEGGLFGGKPLISESDVELMNSVAKTLTRFTQDIKHSLEELGKVFESETWTGRAKNFLASMGIDAFKSDAEKAATTINEAYLTISDSVRSYGDKVRAAFEEAQSKLNINLQPQIQALDTAKTTADIDRIKQEAKAIILGEGEVAEPVETKIPVNPKAEVSPDSNIGASIQESLGPAKESLTAAFEGIGADLGVTVDTELQNAMAQMDTSISTAAQGIGTSLGTALGGIQIPMEGLTTSISAALDEVMATISTKVAEIGNTASLDLTGLLTPISTSISTASGEVSTAVSGIADTVSSALGGLSGQVSGAMAGVPSEISNPFQTGSDTAINIINSMVDQAMGILGTISGRAQGAVGDLSGTLYGSGQSLVQGFINGVNSKMGALDGAIANLTAKASKYFPHSPAKKGAFSGRGYTTHSGKALIRDFARGMQSQGTYLEGTTKDLVASAQKHFGAISTNGASMEGYQRKKILDPVLESNAEKIAKWREREAENLKKSNERIAKLNSADNKSKDKAKKIAKEKADLAKKNKESYQKLLESLEVPDYSDIDRSFNAYWIDGLKEQMNSAVVSVAKDMDLVKKAQYEGLKALANAKKQFGNVQLYPGFDLNRMTKWLKSKEFGNTVYRALEEANIGAIPIEFAISNIDQLRSDLNMGNGVISRAIDAGMAYNSGASDMKYERDNKVEVHYHVADMQEAIRLEKQRERKQMMKMKR